jgi:hypothetical protein
MIINKSYLQATCISLGAVLGAFGSVSQAGAVQFNFTSDSNIDPRARQGFQQAANIWSSTLSDDVTVNLDIGFESLDPGVLGGTLSNKQRYEYQNVRNAFSQDITSDSDRTAVNNLQTGSSVDMFINRTSDNPNGFGSATPYLDDNGSLNNQIINMTTANAKALGLSTSATNDATIEFSDRFNWDFDRSDGIDSGAFDFVGVAAHEIGHALGFISGVDILDINSPPIRGPFSENAFTFVSPLDLFRYSDESANQGAIDWTADNRDKYFSLDGGNTSLGTFSTGTNFGDGRQASHWKDDSLSGTYQGLMDPTLGRGFQPTLSDLDRTAFDAIGWDTQQQPPESVPEPNLGGWLAVGLGLLTVRKIRKHKTT